MKGFEFDSPDLNLAHFKQAQYISRILMELMSDYQKGSNAPFMEPIELDTDKNKDYLEVIKKPLWLKKSEWKLLTSDLFFSLVSLLALPFMGIYGFVI